MTLPLQKNLLGLPYAPAHFVYESVLSKFLDEIPKNIKNLNSKNLLSEFKERYKNWILSSKGNNIIGLENFVFSDFTYGTTQSFDSFYLEHRNRRFRCFKGEYIYHSMVWSNNLINWKFVEDEPLSKGDALVMSVPFADTGDLHDFYTKELLDICLKLNIPILIDCAFFGIVKNITFDFSHSAIDQIVFSLSKTFPVESYRIGLRFTKMKKNDGITIYNESGYLNYIAINVGNEFLKKFNSDYIPDTYKLTQQMFCERLNLTASNTVIFGIDRENRYPEYNRGSNGTNRICFSKFLNNVNHDFKDLIKEK